MKWSVSPRREWHAGALDTQMRIAVKVERLRATYLLVTVGQTSVYHFGLA